MGHRRAVNPAAIAIAKEVRKLAACAVELQTPYGDCNAELLRVLARTLDPPRRTGLDQPARTHAFRLAWLLNRAGVDLADIDQVDIQ